MRHPETLNWLCASLPRAATRLAAATRETILHHGNGRSPLRADDPQCAESVAPHRKRCGAFSIGCAALAAYGLSRLDRGIGARQADCPCPKTTTWPKPI